MTFESSKEVRRRYGRILHAGDVPVLHRTDKGEEIKGVIPVYPLALVGHPSRYTARSSRYRASRRSFTMALIRSSASFKIFSRVLSAIGAFPRFCSVFWGRLPCCPADTFPGTLPARGNTLSTDFLG